MSKILIFIKPATFVERTVCSFYKFGQTICQPCLPVESVAELKNYDLLRVPLPAGRQVREKTFVVLRERIFCYTKLHEEESKLHEERVVQHARQAG